MRAALVIKFTNPVPGRERAAISYAHEVDEFAGKKAAEGTITHPKWYWTSNGDNMVIVEGEYEELLGVVSTPEAQKLENKGMLLMQDFRDEIYVVGRDESLVPYQEAMDELNIR